MALYPNYDRDEIFKAIGKSIARFNELQSQIEDLETITEEHIPLLNESDYTRDFLGNIMDTRESNKDKLETAKDDCRANVSTYLSTGVAEMLDVIPLDTDDVVAEVLDALEDAMYLNADTVHCNTIPPDDNPALHDKDERADIDNAGVGTMNIYTTYPQQTHDELDFELECYEAATPGSELWKVKCGKESSLGTLTTGVLFTDVESKYGKQFIIYRETQIEEFNDNNNQLSNWVLNGAVKRKGNEKSSGSLAEGNSDYYGIYYVKLYDTAGTRTVELYQDSARTIKVAEGSRVGDGTINLAAVGGSGLTGTVDVAYVADDNDIYVKYPFAYEVGDRYYYNSEVGTPKLFQTFFVEEFDRALPCSGTPTVNEDWAKWGLP